MAALLIVPATFIAITVLLAKGLNMNYIGLKTLLNIQWDTLCKLDVRVLNCLFSFSGHKLNYLRKIGF